MEQITVPNVDETNVQYIEWQSFISAGITHNPVTSSTNRHLITFTESNLIVQQRCG